MVGIAKSFGMILLEFKKEFGVETAIASLAMSISGIVYTLLGIVTAIASLAMSTSGIVYTLLGIVNCDSITGHEHIWDRLHTARYSKLR